MITIKANKLICILLAALTIIIISMTGCSGSTSIIVGSKAFSENIMLSEMCAQLIEAHTDYKVERKLGLGGTFVCFEAIQNGDIDMYVEYTGTALTAELKLPVMNDPDAVYQLVKDEFDKQFNIRWSEPVGLNNTYAIGVTAEVAAKYNLKTCSDLVPVAGELVFGSEHDFYAREDGFPGFVELYGITFKDTAKMDESLKYQAIGDNQMDVTTPYATDAQILQYNLVILEDDKNYFPPYYAAPIARAETLEKYPKLAEVLNMLSGQISDAEMIALNYKIDVEHLDIAPVVTDFLKEKNLV